MLNISSLEVVLHFWAPECCVTQLGPRGCVTYKGAWKLYFLLEFVGCVTLRGPGCYVAYWGQKRSDTCRGPRGCICYLGPRSCFQYCMSGCGVLY